MSMMRDYKHLAGTKYQRQARRGVAVAIGYFVPFAGGAMALVFVGWLIVVSP